MRSLKSDAMPILISAILQFQNRITNKYLMDEIAARKVHILCCYSRLLYRNECQRKFPFKALDHPWVATAVAVAAAMVAL